MEKKRITTAKTRIKAITAGEFVKQEGFSPSYILSADGRRLSRVRVVATVVDKFNSETGKFASVTLDDGSDTIRAKVFGSLMLEPFAEGDIVDVIGRIRQYNEEIYIMPEVMTKVTAENEMLRELELQEQDREQKRKRALVMEYKNQVVDLEELKKLMLERFSIDEEETEALLSARQEETKEEENVKESVLKLIERLDKGQGCDYTELLEQSQVAEDVMDKVVRELLESGACYEPKPGKIKKL